MAEWPVRTIYGTPIRRRVERFSIPSGSFERDIVVWDTDRGFIVVEPDQEYTDPPVCPTCKGCGRVTPSESDT